MKKRARAIKPDFEEQEEIDRDLVLHVPACTRDPITFDPISRNLVLYITRLLLSILIPHKPRTLCTSYGKCHPYFYAAAGEKVISRNARVCARYPSKFFYAADDSYE